MDRRRFAPELASSEKDGPGPNYRLAFASRRNSSTTIQINRVQRQSSVAGRSAGALWAVNCSDLLCFLQFLVNFFYYRFENTSYRAK